MPLRRNSKEINSEIEALENLKPFGPFAKKTTRLIIDQIEVLKNGVDTTSDEFDEQSDEDRDNQLDALNWKLGQSDSPPSKQWGGLAK